MDHPFPNDPDIGRLEVITGRIDQDTYIQLMKCLRNSDIAWAIAATRGLGDWTWQEEPFLIVLSSPRAVRKFNNTLHFHAPRIPISETRFREPECSSDELLKRVITFLAQPTLPSFLRPYSLEIDMARIRDEDPYKVVNLLFTAGLNERYIVDLLQPLPR